MASLYGGYFCGWYVLLGVGYGAWLMDPSHRASWGMVAFGAFAYFLVIPGLMFIFLPTLQKLSLGTATEIEEGLERGAFSRGYAFMVGLVGSLVAIVTCAVGYGVAALTFPSVPIGQFDETQLAVQFFALVLTPLAVIAACPWLGQRLLLRKCRRAELAGRRAWLGRIAPVAVGLAWVVTVGWLGYRIANASSVMTARLDFAALPASDEPLQERLRSQPGLATAAVSRQGNTVVVECPVSTFRSHSFIRWGDSVVFEYTTQAGEKHALHLTQIAAEMGYNGLRNASFDQPKVRW